MFRIISLFLESREMCEGMLWTWYEYRTPLFWRLNICSTCVTRHVPQKRWAYRECDFKSETDLSAKQAELIYKLFTRSSNRLQCKNLSNTTFAETKNNFRHLANKKLGYQRLWQVRLLFTNEGSYFTKIHYTSPSFIEGENTISSSRDKTNLLVKQLVLNSPLDIKKSHWLYLIEFIPSYFLQDT